MPFPRAEPHLFPIFCIAFSTAGQGFFRKERRSPPPAKLFSPRPFSRASSHSAGVLRRGGDFHGVGKAFPTGLLFAPAPENPLPFPRAGIFMVGGFALRRFVFCRTSPGAGLSAFSHQTFRYAFPPPTTTLFAMFPRKGIIFPEWSRIRRPRCSFRRAPQAELAPSAKLIAAFSGAGVFPLLSPGGHFISPGKSFYCKGGENLLK